MLRVMKEWSLVTGNIYCLRVGGSDGDERAISCDGDVMVHDRWVR